MNVKSITIEDYPRLKDFWEKNYKISKRDDMKHMRIFLSKNPGLSIFLEENQRIIGSCLASFDGRKGYIQKVVVESNERGKGIGKELVLEVIKRLKNEGALDIRVACDKSLIPFYESCGFKIDNIAHLKIKSY